MSEALQSYALVLIAGLVGLLLLVVIHCLSKLSRGGLKKRKTTSSEALSKPYVDDRAVNTRVTTSMNVALILLSFSLLLIPLAFCYHHFVQEQNTVFIVRALIGIVTMVSFLVLALFYASVKADLSWDREFQRTSRRYQWKNPKA